MIALKTKNKNNLRKKSELSRNYENPSPSNDPWWDIPENYWEVDRRIKEIENGTAEFVTLEDSELKEIFARCRE
jgi:hypothetical protein